MFRALIGGVLTCLWLPAMAQAADGQCVVMSAPPPVEVEGPQSRAAEGEEAASLPIEELWSDSAAGTFNWADAPRIVFRAPEPSDGRSESVLWCGGEGGHECQQGHAPSTVELLTPPIGVLASLHVTPALRRRVAVHRSKDVRGPDGHGERLLRPPRI
ncbi:MAG: hypothetical protein AAF645_04890 [Myxococcota bacterium]